VYTEGGFALAIDAETGKETWCRQFCAGCVADAGAVAAVAEVAYAHYAAATCMTEKVQAISALVSLPSATPERRRALEEFSSEAAGDALVLTKWFMVQASAGVEDILDQVKALLEHPDFSYTNPNRLRSVASVFSGNVRAFHAADGSGYELIGDIVAKVDPLNPQVASRLAGSFSTWRKFDEGRQELMKAQLKRFRDLPNVSKDTFEVAKRSLD
jgi:aminopeptidase N